MISERNQQTANRVPVRPEGMSPAELVRERDTLLQVIAEADRVKAQAEADLEVCDALLKSWGYAEEKVRAQTQQNETVEVIAR